MHGHGNSIHDIPPGNSVHCGKVVALTTARNGLSKEDVLRQEPVKLYQILDMYGELALGNCNW